MPRVLVFLVLLVFFAFLARFTMTGNIFGSIAVNGRRLVVGRAISVAITGTVAIWLAVMGLEARREHGHRGGHHDDFHQSKKIAVHEIAPDRVVPLTG